MMQRWLVAAVGTAVSACFTGPPTYIVPLAELDAEMHLGPDDRILAMRETLRLHEPSNGGDHCRVLSPRNTKVTLDGVSAEMEPGGAKNQFEPLECRGPAFSWDDPPKSAGPSTFEITDGSATWTFVVWQPFDYRDFKLISHPMMMALSAGDTVILRLEPPGAISNASLKAIDGGTDLFELDEATGLSRSGSELSFVMPAVSRTSAILIITSDLEVRIDRCDAPRGCPTIYDVYDSMPVTIAP